MKTIVLALTMAAAAGPAAAQEPAHHWANEVLKGYARQLSSKVDDQHVAVEPLGDFGSHYLLMIYRDGNGPAEQHERETDLYVMQTGAATLIVGGTIADAKTIGPGEIRGAHITGGERIALAPGDTVNIRPNVPHQVVVAPGERVSYLIVKVRE